MFLILLLMGLSVELHIQASAQQRKSRDIIEFFKKAGENALKAISGLIPGGKPTSQLTTQPRGPKIPLNTINEDAIKPVIPYKRNMIGKLKTGRKEITNLDLVFKLRDNRSGNKRVMEQQQKKPSKDNNNDRNKNNNKLQLNSAREKIKTKIELLPLRNGQ